ncbi:dihydrofolate reductase [Hyphococcus flavus]|uniref:Dihydrofolate reductase n=1 Tax=Hyphococcus flavus TaxID=1866326 RepID=A0AAF0CF12_9PROT|nr:dihydrofolate reductase [Hyphococcus flavus]WDI32066.1 dihydrofolate reductase [Hyphococcus flavus]
MDDSPVKITLVAAASRNHVIGAGGDLIWRISDDFKWFKSMTMGKPMVMGRKTFDSIGRALPGRDNIVVTRSSDFAGEKTYIARSLDSAIKLARHCADVAGADELCVIGGGEIYAQALSRADRIYLTRVDVEIEGDTVFPEIDSRDWAETRAGSGEKNTHNEYACEFFILDRKSRIRAKRL